ncbi:MAG: undecaprenyl-diphosphatase [Sulfobacillus thermosulfidooxidans]|uniref:Undecaprenyl-diphosphatase n=1 Tax=Sulfobacillus thermosulfidooxidans TaxID=28034 RepID=A0A2T2X266_SULTH|nr:MAG: undecaprenyl-diphosphatase [Sulfobacillus thermosulfidooxidans]
MIYPITVVLLSHRLCIARTLKFIKGGNGLTTNFPIPAFDRHWFHVINSWATISPLLNDLAIVLAKDAVEIWAGIFLLLWFWPPLRQNRARRAVVYATVAGFLSLAVSMTLSHVLPYRPRPFVFEPKMVHLLISHAPDTSFPSDHATGSFAFAIALFYAGRRDGWWATLLAAAISIARVFVGVHWPTDVLAGDAIGMIAGFIVLAWHRHLEGLVMWLFRLFRFRPQVSQRYGRRLG